MFDALKGMAGLGGIMKDLPRIKERFEQVRAELAEMTVEAQVGGGAVTAVADGKMRIRSVEVDPVMLSILVKEGEEADRGMAEDLITSAVNAAIRAGSGDDRGSSQVGGFRDEHPASTRWPSGTHVIPGSRGDRCP